MSYFPKANRFTQAATVCLFAPLVAIAIRFFVVAGTSDLSIEGQAKSAMIAGTFMALVVMAGLACGIISLFGIPKYGAKGILWKAVVGLIIPVGFAVLAIPSVISLDRDVQIAVKARTHTESLKQTTASER